MTATLSEDIGWGSGAVAHVAVGVAVEIERKGGAGREGEAAAAFDVAAHRGQNRCRWKTRLIFTQSVRTSRCGIGWSLTPIR